MQVDPSKSQLYYGQVSQPAGKEMDKNAFLQILTMQMSHQDPLSSPDPSTFVAQLAQFSALEQMQNLNKAFEEVRFLEAAGIIDRNVVLSGEDGSSVTGKAEKVRLEGRDVEVMVNGKFYSLKQVIQVE